MNPLKKYLHKRFLFPLFIGFILFILVRFFVVDVVVVRSPGMEPVLKEGEWVFVKKFFTVKQNDIVLVALPLSERDEIKDKVKVFKRVTGMPGDTVVVATSDIYINGLRLPGNETMLHNFIFKIKTQSDSTLIDTESRKYLIDDSCAYMLVMTKAEFNKLNRNKRFLSATSNMEDSALYDESVFPYTPGIKWNKDYFGPLYIPKAGDKLNLDTSNLKLYERIITDFEGNSLEIIAGKIFINERETATYEVKKNYYFVTGDNFDCSIDSRHWGFVPEGRIEATIAVRK